MEQLLGPILQRVRKKSSKEKKASRDTKYNNDIALFEAGESKEQPIKKKRRTRSFLRPGTPQLLSVDDKGVAGQLLNDLMNTTHKNRCVLELWALLASFPQDLSFFTSSPNEALADIGCTVQQGRADR